MNERFKTTRPPFRHKKYGYDRAKEILRRKRPNPDTGRQRGSPQPRHGAAPLRTPYLTRRLVAVSGKTTHGVNSFASSKSIEA